LSLNRIKASDKLNLGRSKLGLPRRILLVGSLINCARRRISNYPMLFSYNRLLVPIDFSEESFQAQRLTLEFLDNPSQLHVIYVLPHLNPGEPGLMWQTINDYTRKDYVEKKFRDRFSGPEYEGIHFQVAMGNPCEEIVKYAQVKAMDLIIIPSHKRNILGRLLHGSVADKVIRSAICPVLVLHRDSLTQESVDSQLIQQLTKKLVPV